MRWLPLLVLLAGCNLIFTLEDGGEPSGAAFRRTVTIHPPTNVLLPKFPVGILIDDQTLIGVDADNMRFVGDGGIELSSELIHDDATGALEAWVLMPELADEVSITFEYGGATPRESDPRAAWDASTFIGVWHLSGSQGFETDSANSVAGQVNVRDIVESQALSVPGVAGAARRFDGNDAMCAVNGANFQFGTKSFSFGVWVNHQPTVTDFDQPIVKGGGNDGNPGFNLELGENNWNANACCDLTVNQGNISGGSSSPIFQRWVHLLATVDTAIQPNMLRLYIDNGLAGEQVLNGAEAWGGVNTPDQFCIGGTDAPAEFVFHGDIDEVRIYNTVISVEWFATETFNLENQAQFIELGAVTPVD